MRVSAKSIVLLLSASLIAVAMVAGADDKAEKPADRAAAKTETTGEDKELAVGTKAPEFNLKGTDGEKHTLASYTGKAKATVVVFTCNTCPYSKAYEPVLLELAAKYKEQPVKFVLINSNSIKVKPEDSYEHMVELAKAKSYPFPYLYDESQDVAHSYGARVTPHVFLVDDKQICRYRGRIDDNVKREEAKQFDLINAIDAMLAGKEIPVAETKAFGCGIKWKPAAS
jgi:peroxiredoxin